MVVRWNLAGGGDIGDTARGKYWEHLRREIVFEVIVGSTRFGGDVDVQLQVLSQNLNGPKSTQSSAHATYTQSN